MAPDRDHNHLRRAPPATLADDEVVMLRKRACDTMEVVTVSRVIDVLWSALLGVRSFHTAICRHWLPPMAADVPRVAMLLVRVCRLQRRASCAFSTGSRARRVAHRGVDPRTGSGELCPALRKERACPILGLTMLHCGVQAEIFEKLQVSDPRG